SGEVSFRTLASGAILQNLPIASGATLSCDAGLAGSAPLAYSMTAMGQQIVPPLAGVRTFNGAFGGPDIAQGVAVEPTGNVLVVGAERAGSTNDNWRITRYTPSLTTVLASTSYDAPTASDDRAFAVLPLPGGN